MTLVECKSLQIAIHSACCCNVWSRKRLRLPDLKIEKPSADIQCRKSSCNIKWKQVLGLNFSVWILYIQSKILKWSPSSPSLSRSGHISPVYLHRVTSTDPTSCEDISNMGLIHAPLQWGESSAGRKLSHSWWRLVDGCGKIFSTSTNWEARARQNSQKCRWRGCGQFTWMWTSTMFHKKLLCLTLVLSL